MMIIPECFKNCGADAAARRNVPAVQPVSPTNPPSLASQFQQVSELLRRYDRVWIGVEGGTPTIVTDTVKAMVYFAVACVDNPGEAEKLEGWSQVTTPEGTSPYFRPMKHVAREVSSSTKLAPWAAIAQHVAEHGIGEDDFLRVLMLHGGIDRWHRKLPKDTSKGGRHVAGVGTANDRVEPAVVITVAEKVAA